MAWEVIDVSKFQTVSNYTSAANSVSGVIIRVGYRGYGSSGTLVTDPKWTTHYNGFAGKTKIGVYWFSQAINNSEAIAEANYVYNLIKGKQIDFPVYLDSEIADVSTKNGRADKLSSATRTSVTIAFMNRMKELGYRVGVYASDAWFKSNLNLSQLYATGCSLWVAKYSSASPVNVKNYDGWQYTSDATISGINGRVDKSHFYNDVAGWNSTPAPTPVPPTPSGQYYPKYTGSSGSLIEALAAVGETDTSFAHRTVIANANGIADYSGTAAQNIELLNKLKAGTLIKPGTTPEPVKKDINSVAINIPYTSFAYSYGDPINCGFTLAGCTAGTDYNYSYSNNVNVGTATCTITGIGNYTGTRSFTYSIVAANINNSSVTLGYDSANYTGSNITPPVSVKSPKGNELVRNAEYTVTYGTYINTGSYNVYINGIGNYTGTATKIFTITPKPLNSVGQISIPYDEYEYTGSPIEPQVTITGLTQGVHYSVSYVNNINIGTATVRANGIGNYGGYITKDFAIVKPKIPINVKDITLSYTSTVYNGSAQCPEITVQDCTLNVDYTVTVTNNINIGTATIDIKGIGEYIGTVNRTFNIVAESLDNCAITIPKNSYTFSKEYITPEVTIKKDSLLLVKGKDYDLVYSNNFNVGTATISITAKGNFTGNKEITFQITPYDIANDKTFFYLSETIYTYNRKEQCPSVGNNKDYTYNIDYEIDLPEDVINAGEKTFTIRGIGNYSGSFTMSFAIQRYSIYSMTMKFIEDVTTFYYTSAEIKPEVKIEDLVVNRDYILSYHNNTNPGTATVVADGIGNYTGVLKLSFKIEPRSLRNTIAKYGRPSLKTIYRIEDETSELEIYPDATMSTTLEKGLHYAILEESRFESTDFILVSFTVKGLNGFLDEVVYRFRVIKVEPSKPIDYTDDGIYNFGDIDLADMTADGNYDFGDLDYKDDSIYPESPWPMYVKKIITAAALQAYFDNIDPEPEDKVKDGEDYDFDTMSTMLLASYDDDTGFNIDYNGNEQGEDPIVDPNPDDGLYNFGDIDLGDETAVGDYDFGDLDADPPVDPDSVADGDYDFNTMTEDISEDWILPGTEFELDETPVYSTYSTKTSFEVKDGKYYVYKGNVMNNRVRLCRLESDVDVPVKSAGWFNVNDLLNLGKIAVNDQVLVTGELREFANGSGGKIDKNGSILYVKEIITEERVSYPYALSTGYQTARIGFASEDMLSKVRPE